MNKFFTYLKINIGRLMSDVKKNSGPVGRLAAWKACDILLPFLLGILVLAIPMRIEAMDSVDAAQLQTMLERERGKAVLVNFWASWCGPCRKEMPDLIKLRELMSSKDLYMVGVALDFDVGAADAYAKQFGLNFPVVHAGDDVMSVFEVGAIPKTMIWDREGRLRVEHVGVMPLDVLVEGVGRFVRQ